MQYSLLYFSTNCTHTAVKTQRTCAKVNGNACEGKQRFRNPLISLRFDVRLDRDTVDPSLLPGVHKTAVALRCMHVPDPSHSNGKAKRSTNEELIYHDDDDTNVIILGFAEIYF